MTAPVQVVSDILWQRSLMKKVLLSPSVMSLGAEAVILEERAVVGGLVSCDAVVAVDSDVIAAGHRDRRRQRIAVRVDLDRELLDQRVGRAVERRQPGGGGSQVVRIADLHAETDLLLQAGLLQIGQEKRGPAPAHARVVAVDVVSRRVGRRPNAHAIEIVAQRQADLLEVVAALVRRAASRAACTAGSNNETNVPMMAITTKSSISVNPLGDRCR